MLVTMFVPVASHGANFSDTRGHWAESFIDRAVQYGFVQGYPDGTFAPDKSVTRAEFTTMINKALKNTATATITFKDVPYSEWYYQDVAKALAATYVAGYEDNTFKPNSPITRQEAAVIISRIIPTYGSSGNLNAFPDRSSIADWAYTAFQKVNGKKYMGAYDDGNLYPLARLTRAQTAKIICDILDNERIVTTDPVIRSNRTTLSNTIYSNGVTIHRDLDDGSATIENCVVLGNLRVQGGGDNSITFNNSRAAQVAIEKNSSRVRFTVRGESVISSLTAANEAIIQTSNLTGGLYGSGINNLSTLSSSKIKLEGNFPKVTVSGSSASLELSSGTITSLTVASNASRSSITVDSRATVSTADVNAESYFKGTGTISRMNANANGITYEKKPTNVVVGSGYKDPTLVDAEGDIKFSPANGTNRVSLSSKITITFKDEMTLYNGKEITNSNIWDFVELREGSSNGTKLDYSATINNAKTIITITPTNNFKDDTRYYVVIPRNSISDLKGNGNTAQSIWFSTGNDSAFVTFSPAHGATGVSRTDGKTITFSEAVETNNGTAITNNNSSRDYLLDNIIFRETNSDGTRVSFDVSISSNGRIITITPRNTLKSDQSYYLAIANNSIRTQKDRDWVNGNVTWSTGVASPGISIASNATVADTSVTLNVTPNQAGTIYAIAVRNPHTKTPTAANVVDGRNGDNAAVPNNSKSVSSSGATTIQITGLEKGVSYTFYVVLRSGSVNSAVVDRAFTTGLFTAVTNITGVPDAATAGTPLTLTGTVAPTDATNKTITWSLVSTGTTGATLSGTNNSTFNATAAGKATVKATITNGTTSGNFTKDFEITVSAAPVVNKTALTNAIGTANAAKTGVVTSTNGNDVETTVHWVTSAQMATFESAISAATTVNANASATQAQVDSAVSTLNTAITTFNGQKALGTKPDKSALNSAIDEADNAKYGVEVSDYGTDVPPGTYWVTPEVMTSFNTAISNAIAVRNNTTASQIQVDEQVSLLNFVIPFFNAAKKPGTQ